MSDITDDPITTGGAGDESAADPAPEAVEQPAESGEPTAGGAAPAVEDRDLVAEPPAVEEPVAEEPVVEEPVAEEPAAEEPAVEEASPEEPAAEVEEPAQAPAPRRKSPYDRPGRWYVIHTQSGYENKVRNNLMARTQSMNMEERIFEVVIPMEDVVEFKNGKKVVVQKKVFPGYLLVRMRLDDDSWFVVRNTPGVTGLSLIHI